MNSFAYNNISVPHLPGNTASYRFPSSPLRNESTVSVSSTKPDGGDKITLSPEGVKRAEKSNSTDQLSTESTNSSAAEKSLNLTAEELRQLQKLKIRDAEVRSHEQAHLSVAGQFAKGSASFTLQKGPDGNSYAVGGEVPIDLSQESTPAATINKMRTIRRAALAPANPSGADRRIAAQASAKEMQARQKEMAEQQDQLLAAETQNAPQTKDSTSPNLHPNESDSSVISSATLRAGLEVYKRISAYR